MWGFSALARSMISSSAVWRWMAQWSLFCTSAKNRRVVLADLS